MEDFLLQESTEIKKHIADEWPKEICGVIAGRKKPKYIRCTNIAEDDNEFIIDPLEFIGISMTKNISAIVHSHNGHSKASDWDVAQCNSHKLPFIIFGNDGINIIYPKELMLKGRIYVEGNIDCFEAVRDWYISKGIYTPPRDSEWDPEWYNKGLNYLEDNFKDWGLEEVKDNTLKFGDVLVFKMFNQVPDHLGVYEGNDRFFHHAVDRLSCSENLWEYWGKYLYKVLRHEKASSIKR